ncbi:putative gamma-glutamylcyclotransferase CG2811 isoform X2 [Condylostylus longicornis]|uniref:putative gamma-glutamylcyclotransferase CG2811 isoform X2 n=1 Tax=Condylostylus longicornis TaxID=2530218 RepID=UPI00244DB1E7|nr:putative gamma-glutamylcyclotransferase CG2811 isoform X2 [Condylostylus longicornis]
MVIITRIALKSYHVMSRISKNHHVFVYGTLKRNQPNHYWLTDPENGEAIFIGEGKTKEKFPLVVGTRYNIPFLLNKVGVGNNIEGEIYEINDKMLSKLDILEDYPQYYDREIRDIQMGNETLKCWLYLIRKFPESLLNKKLLTSYSNTKELPYRERYLRTENIKPIDDLSF